MVLNHFRNCFIFAASSVVLATSALAEPAIKNIVLVHGAFVDGSANSISPGRRFVAGESPPGPRVTALL